MSQEHSSVRQYFDRCDRALFEDPPRGFDLAVRAPEMARATGDLELLALGLAVQGSGYRIVGQPDRAEEIYAEALALQEHCSALALADIRRRFASLRWSQKRVDEGLELINQALAAYQGTEHPVDEAMARIIRGVLLLSGAREGRPWLVEAVGDFAMALRLAKQESPRVTVAALQNFAIAAAEGAVRADDLLIVLEALSHLELDPGSIPAAKVFWARGLIVLRFGSEVYAANLLEQARNQLARCGLPMETALVSLDMGAIYQRNEDWEALENVAAHAVMLFRDIYPFATLTALTMWREAVLHRELDEAMALGIRRAVATQELRFLECLERRRPLAQKPDKGPSAKSLPAAPDSSAPPPTHLVTLQRARAAFGPRYNPRPYQEFENWSGHCRLYLEPDDAAAVDHMAREEQLSRPEFVRRLIRRAARLPLHSSRRRPRRRYSKTWSGKIDLNLESEEAAAVDEMARRARTSRSENIRRLIRQEMKERGLTYDA